MKIDNDCHIGQSWIQDCVTVVRAVCKTHGLKVVSIRMSRTKKGPDYYIGIEPRVTADRANRLQWLPRDDSRRVDYNRARIRSGHSDWNKLFEDLGRRFHVLHPSKVPAGTQKTRKR